MSHAIFTVFRIWFIAALALLASTVLLPCLASAQSSEARETKIEELGDDQFRVGQIVVDKAARSFSIPATLLDQGVPDAPLEFLVVTRQGPKSYESMLEIDANAFEFNVACLLIGLNPDNAKLPKGKFEADPAKGDPVALFLGWSAGGERVTNPVTDFIHVSSGEEPSNEWVYLGSYFFPDGRYAADVDGLAVGFVNDRESIIQHSKGIGLVSYGATTLRRIDGVSSKTPLQLIVSRLGQDS